MRFRLVLLVVGVALVVVVGGFALAGGVYWLAFADWTVALGLTVGGVLSERSLRASERELDAIEREFRARYGNGDGGSGSTPSG